MGPGFSPDTKLIHSMQPPFMTVSLLLKPGSTCAQGMGDSLGTSVKNMGAGLFVVCRTDPPDVFSNRFIPAVYNAASDGLIFPTIWK